VTAFRLWVVDQLDALLAQVPAQAVPATPSQPELPLQHQEEDRFVDRVAEVVTRTLVKLEEAKRLERSQKHRAIQPPASPEERERRVLEAVDAGARTTRAVKALAKMQGGRVLGTIHELQARGVVERTDRGLQRKAVAA
jgi:predicted Rossmann fold nucleotide-binding protein DprA/Smf involved in DNA uptake